MESARAHRRVHPTSAAFALVLAGSLLAEAAHAQSASYPVAAPVDQYRAASAEEEIAFARSAAPPSISADAAVLVLGKAGYEAAAPGKNGFVCFVQRAWAAGFDDPEFWNPKIRSPNCFNASAARSELSQYLQRTEWVMAGASREQVIERTRSAFAEHRFTDPDPGSFSFMLSKDGYINDEVAGPWLPHIMLFVPHGQAAAWGADLQGSPILGRDGSAIESTVLFIPVRRWSDGSPAPAPAQQHTH